MASEQQDNTSNKIDKAAYSLLLQIGGQDSDWFRSKAILTGKLGETSDKDDLEFSLKPIQFFVAKPRTSSYHTDEFSDIFQQHAMSIMLAYFDQHTDREDKSRIAGQVILIQDWKIVDGSAHSKGPSLEFIPDY